MPRAGLDSSSVVRAAAELADEEGLAELTLARLAGRLGVKAPSLYGHVGGLADLRQRICDEAATVIADELQEAAAGRSGLDALRATADAYRAFAKRHPGRYAALQRVGGSSDPGGDGQNRVVTVMLAVLRGYGREGDAAIHAVRCVRAALHGFVVLEIGDGFGIPLSLDESFAALVAMLDAGLRGSPPAPAAG